jgi:hypothetical protein
MKTAILALTLFSAAFGAEARFESASFVVLIDQRCPEGYVTCDDVKYVGTSKKTGKSITLIGSTVHSIGADGVTPTQFQGYRFKNGATEYFVSIHGYMEVTKGDKILVHEEGRWDWEKKAESGSRR